MRTGKHANQVSVSKSVDKMPPTETVDKPVLPSEEELSELIAARFAPPKVQQKELARRLGVSASALSKFESGEALIPGGRAAEHYRAALADLKRAKRMDGAA